ncbi:uncharacterized protein LOC62_07G008882 [Vanrija pseudolonga]|uniref:Uncharacterized protein n=1 Tax=Vanrija pseudolonga TaxID=143232 RepID=A0AAF0YES9_9TREE|nr:hypothetical protein LOC62_07G008882 [Vanrija pseudolonga]
MKLRIPATLLALALTASAKRHYLFAGCLDVALLPEGYDYVSATGLSMSECDAHLGGSPDPESFPHSVWIPPLDDAPSRCFARKFLADTTDWGDGVSCPPTQARLGLHKTAFPGFQKPQGRPGAKTAIMKKDDGVYCPQGGTPCRLSMDGGYGYECVDFQTSFNNCGGCAVGEFNGKGNWAARLGVE